MSATDRQVIAKVKSIEGEVTATALDGSKRVLMVGDFIYSDEIVDTANGKIFLVQDGDIVLQKDIAAIFSQENLSPEEKSNVDKILKELEGEDMALLAKLSKDKLAALASGEAGQDKHEAPFIVSHEPGVDPGVHSQAQILVSFEPMPLAENDFFTQRVIAIPETGISGSNEAIPIELRATTRNQLDDTTQLSAHSVGESFGFLAENHNIVKQDIQASFDIFMHSHPDAVLAITVTGNIADYNAAPLEFPAPIILPFGIGMQPWTVIAGDAPNTVSYLYRKADLNLFNAISSDSKQSLMDLADQHIQLIHDLRDIIEEQISGISSLSLDQFEIKANLNAQFSIFDDLRVQLQQEIAQLSSLKAIAESNLATWGSTMHNFGITINNGNPISNNGAILELESKWKLLGGTPETMPSVLESLYASQAIYLHDVNLLSVEIMAKQNMLTALLHDLIGPVLDLLSYNPVGDADYKQVLNQASEELTKLDIMAQGYKNALLNSLEGYDLVLRTGLTNDADFAFKTQVLLVDSTSDLTLYPSVSAELFTQNGGLVNVDALASGLKVDFNGHLTHDQVITVESHFGVLNIEITLHLDLKFANPSADENIHIEIPGIPGLNWDTDPPPVLPAGWVLSDNNLILDLLAVPHSERTDIIQDITLSFDTSLLKNIDLSQVVFKIIVNSQVVPVGDNEADLSNNTLHQEFGFDVIGKFPARGLYMVESISQNDALDNPEKHVSIDIKPLLENIAIYLNLLNGPTETNFLNNTKIEFKFFNVDPIEPPKVLLSSGVESFVKVGDSWVLTGQALKNYVEAWEVAISTNNVAEILKLEHPYIIAAPYGADDLAVTVFGVINGANQVVVQPIVPIVIDAVAQPISGSVVNLSNVHFDTDHTIFTLKVNIVAPDADGSEARLIDINLTNVFQFDPARSVPTDLDPNWQVFSNNSVWHIEIIGDEIHLMGSLYGVPGTTSSQLDLGFNTALLQYLPKDANGNYEIVIGGPAFNQQGTNPAGVISQEIVGPNEQDFDFSNDTAGPAYLAAGTSVEVPAATVILREAQVDDAHLTPGVDCLRIDVSAALDNMIANYGVDEFAYVFSAGSIAINFTKNGVIVPELSLAGEDLFNKVVAYNSATTAAEKAEAGSILYNIGQYNTGTAVIQVDYVLFVGFSDLGGPILPATTVIFDAVGSGTDVPVFTSNGFTAGSIPTISVLGLDFNVTARDITNEIVVITIHLPHAPDSSVLVANAPSGLSFGWQLDPGSSGIGSPWSLNGDTLTGTFNLATLNTIDIASSFSLDFNNTVLQYLNPNVAGNNIIDFSYSIHSIDSASPNNYITGDNQSPDLTGVFEVILIPNENVLVSENVIGTFPEIYLGNLPDVPNADINLGDGAFDFNAANAARMSTMLHVTIDFADPDPALTRTVAIFLPISGGNLSADIQQKFLDWQLLAGDENGWSIDTSYNSSTEIKLVKTFAGGSESLSTGNIDDYVPVSFLLTAVGSFDQRTLTANGPSPIVPQEMGLHVQVSTTAVVDIGGGQTAIQTTSSPVIATSQDITVPPFVMTDAKVPAFTDGNDYYYIAHPGAGLSNVSESIPFNFSITEHVDPVVIFPAQIIAANQITGYVNAIKTGTPASTYSATIDSLLLLYWNIDVPANTDYSTLALTLTSSPTIYQLAITYFDNSIFQEMTVTVNVNITATYTLAMAQADVAYILEHKGNPFDFQEVDAALLRLDPAFSTVLDTNNSLTFYGSLDPTLTSIYTQQIAYSYSIISAEELGIGHIFNPGAGDDIVIGSHGRDVFNAGEQSFVTTTTGGVATNTESAITFGNEVFVGGLGRDWIESGSGHDVAYSDGTPLAVAIPADIGPAYAPVFLTAGLLDSSGHVLGIFLPKVTDVIATGAGDDVIYTGGANYDSYISAYPGVMPSMLPGQFVGGVADGVSDKSAGVLVFAGPGDNVIFSGFGADVIILDDTLGLTRVVPTTGTGGLTVSMSDLSGLSYVYNAIDASGDTILGGDYSDMFTMNTLNTVQSLISSGQISLLTGNTDPLAAYLYDVIRPIYDSSYDTKLSYTLSSSTNPLTETAINAEHGENTLVYWKDSVSSDPNSADIVMYFDVTQDRINLTGLFNELAPNMTDAQRFAAIHVTPVTSVVPIDATSEALAGTNVGMDGVRISVTIGSTQYQIADLANVHLTDVTSNLANIFEVHNAPEMP
jgi:hypothetical protein